MIQQLEHRFGRFSIRHLMNYIIAGYAVGYLIYVATLATYNSTGINLLSLLYLQPHLILKGQVWRLISWVLIPPLQNPLFEIIMMVFYWQLGNTLEDTWGSFRFNLYIFGGMFFTVIGAFVVYAITYFSTGISASIGGMFTTQYINLSIFLAFAMSYPEMRVMLYFLIPVKMKWMAIVYVAIVAYEFLLSGTAGKIAIVSSLLNFIIFYLMTRNYKSISPYEQARKARWRQATSGPRGSGGGAGPFGFGGQAGGARSAGQPGAGPATRQQPTGGFGFPGGGRTVNIARHKCAICGRTDISNPELTFRFCSKCNGNYEYCNDHLFTHSHIL